MIKAIIYSSHQGFSKQYAYEYAIKTGIPIYSLEEAEKLVDGTSVIFFSWIKNRQIFDIEKCELLGNQITKHRLRDVTITPQGRPSPILLPITWLHRYIYNFRIR
jgi:hypothetical protein